MSLHSYSSNLSCWANFLNANPAWTGALESAFDQIGFTSEYVQSAVKRKKFHKPKALKDNLWGMVEIDPVCAWLIDGPLLQRLRYVKQLGVTYLTYPGAQHTRFEHSIGVLYVVNRLLDAFHRNKVNAGTSANDHPHLRAASYEDLSYEATIVRLAALLHDIGHIPFSHATENSFIQNEASTNVGPFKTKDFLDEFRLFYLGIKPGCTPIKAVRDQKSLSEIFSAAIVLSKRFREFITLSCPYPFNGTTAEEVTCDIAALILGDPIAGDDRALPQLISGPFDADKVDYMLRDAHACGLELGIDVSRLFFRASVYEVRNSKAITDNVSSPLIRDAAPPFKVFLIDQSGTESALEMGLARLSLYSRVYYHQLTRNAESQLYALMDQARSRSTDAKVWSNFIDVWTHSDQSLLYCLSHDKDCQITQTARSILERRFLKRGGCFSIDLFQPSALGEALPTIKLTKRLTNLHEESYDKLTKLISDSKKRDDFIEKISSYCALYRKELLSQGEPAENVPNDSAPEFVRFIFPGNSDRALVPQALILTPSNEVSQQRQRESSYVDAGRLVTQRGYLLVPRAWRELALLALQKVIFECDELAVHIEHIEPNPDDEAEECCRVLFRPVLIGDASANESRINWRTVQSHQTKLSHLYAGAEVLIENDSSIMQGISANAPGLSFYEGEHNWTLRSGSDLDLNKIGAFIRQFPPNLRPKAVALICKLTVLTRTNTSELLIDGLKPFLLTLNGSAKVTLVPLTPSSGELLRTYLKDHAKSGAMSGCHIASTLNDALADSSAPETIIFFDDNIVSGTQCFNQLDYWLNISSRSASNGANYFTSSLDEGKLSILRTIPIGFAFAVGNDEAKSELVARLSEFAKNNHLKLLQNPFSFGQNLSQHSGKVGSSSPIDPELREFLSVVGQCVIRTKVEQDDRYTTDKAIQDECNNRALGYSNAEGMLVTSLNVPSSTYTALWCPGTYLSKTHDGISREVPWLPLFIRSGHIGSTVIF